MTATRINPQEWTETLDGWLVRHFEDGTGRVEISKDFASPTNGSWSAWGSIYEYKVTDPVSFPFGFSTRPTIRVEPYYLGNAISGVEIGPNWSNAYTAMPYIYVTRPNVPSGNNDYRVTVYVTGTKS